MYAHRISTRTGKRLRMLAICRLEISLTKAAASSYVTYILTYSPLLYVLALVT